MALQEEYEYAAFRCAFCNFFNPARKCRPIAPRLPIEMTPAVTIQRPSSSESSNSSNKSINYINSSLKYSFFSWLWLGNFRPETVNQSHWRNWIERKNWWWKERSGRRRRTRGRWGRNWVHWKTREKRHWEETRIIFTYLGREIHNLCEWKIFKIMILSQIR